MRHVIDDRGPAGTLVRWPGTPALPDHARRAEPEPAARPATGKRRVAKLADRIGATASLVCAVHCLALPFVLGLLPLIGLGFLAGHTFERIFVICAAALAGLSILGAYRHHRRAQPVLLMVPGIVLLVFGVAIDLDAHVLVHTVSVVSGGILLASAHLVNLMLAQRRHGACRARARP